MPLDEIGLDRLDRDHQRIGLLHGLFRRRRVRSADMDDFRIDRAQYLFLDLDVAKARIADNHGWFHNAASPGKLLAG